MIKRETLKTEQQNKKTIDIDQFPIFKVLETINDESISSDSVSAFNTIKQKLLKMAEKNLGHYSIQD